MKLQAFVIWFWPKDICISKETTSLWRQPNYTYALRLLETNTYKEFDLTMGTSNCTNTFTFSLKLGVDMQELLEVEEDISFLFKGSHRTFQLG